MKQGEGLGEFAFWGGVRVISHRATHTHTQHREEQRRNKSVQEDACGCGHVAWGSLNLPSFRATGIPPSFLRRPELPLRLKSQHLLLPPSPHAAPQPTRPTAPTSACTSGTTRRRREELAWRAWPSWSRRKRDRALDVLPASFLPALIVVERDHLAWPRSRCGYGTGGGPSLLLVCVFAFAGHVAGGVRGRTSSQLHFCLLL